MVCIIWAPESAQKTCPTVAKWMWLQHSRLALHSHLQTAITSSFQLQIKHRLNLWTPDFPSFETRYRMHNLSFRKWSKCAQKLPKWGGAKNFSSEKVSAKIFALGNVNAKFIFNFAQLPSNGHNFFVSAPNCTPFEVLESWIPKIRNDIYHVDNGLQ